MVPSQLFSFFFVFLSFVRIATSALRICPALCHGSGPMIAFPFRLTGQSERCGYPGFELTCNRGETIIQIPASSGAKFFVQNIDYMSQTISINDPDHCLPKRFLDYSFSLLGSPFSQGNHFDYTFLNCSSHQILDVSGYRYVNCLSTENYTVVAIPASRYNESELSKWSCSWIRTVPIPVLWSSWSNLEDGVILSWSQPNCMSCEERQGVCGFKNFDSLDMDIGCGSLSTSPGLPRSAKYGIIVGVGIPGLLCFIGLGCYLCGTIRARYERRHSNTGLSTAIIPQPMVVLTGLDGATIESYPKIMLGESGRLPKPNDNTCPICLSDYQPKETLRTIPECNHYFHVNCIDEWLRMNATCPLCRNSPEVSDIVTPSTSSSYSNSSLLSVP